MRLVFINTDYEEFLLWLYGRAPALADAPYADQLSARNASLFSVADFYSHAFRSLGHDAHDLHVNNPWLQSAWARERGLTAPSRSVRAARARARIRRYVPAAAVRAIRRRARSTDSGEDQILAAQLNEIDADVVINQGVGQVSASSLRRYAPRSVLVGQVASTVQVDHLREYDLIVSSLPPILRAAEQLQIPTVLSRFGFDERVLNRVGAVERDIPVSFVGSLTSAHPRRVTLLEQLCRSIDVHVYGSRRDVTSLPRSSVIRRRYRGPAWGIDMYRVLARSRITLNEHGDVWVGGINATEDHANNIRLFEATGCGALLVTDAKSDLAEMFEVGREVITYDSPEHCVEVIRLLHEDSDEVAAIARRGQSRTLSDHTYAHRARELEPALTAAVQLGPCRGRG